MLAAARLLAAYYEADRIATNWFEVTQLRGFCLAKCYEASTIAFSRNYHKLTAQ